MSIQGRGGVGGGDYLRERKGSKRYNVDLVCTMIT